MIFDMNIFRFLESRRTLGAENVFCLFQFLQFSNETGKKSAVLTAVKESPLVAIVNEKNTNTQTVEAQAE